MKDDEEAAGDDDDDENDLILFDRATEEADEDVRVWNELRREEDEVTGEVATDRSLLFLPFRRPDDCKEESEWDEIKDLLLCWFDDDDANDDEYVFFREEFKDEEVGVGV